MNPRKAVIRDSATPVYVYNDALCVYLYDEGSLDVLRELLRSRRYGEAHPNQTFYENLCVKPFAEEVSRHGLSVSYTLEQDDEVVAEVGVGPALNEQELAIARWLVPQRARLSLPTGRLCIETPNSMRLDGGRQGRKPDRGVVVEVPPGDYVLTLYRIDWQDMRRAGIRRRVPQEFLLLTPLEQADAASSSPILRLVHPEPDMAWLGATTIEGREFTGQAYSNYYFTQILLNLDRAAAERLGLRLGSVFRLTFGRLRLDAVFLGNRKLPMVLGEAQTQPLDRMAGKAALAFGSWATFSGHEVLALERYKSKRPIPEKHHNTWLPATGTVLDRTFDNLASAEGLFAARAARLC